MNMFAGAVQSARSWHEGGLFMGMHWLWWGFWVLMLCALGWAFVRMFRDRAEMHRRVAHDRAAEDILRTRFASGEIDDQELARGLKVLRETGAGPTTRN